MVKDSGLRTCRINLSCLELVKSDLFRNAAAWKKEKSFCGCIFFKTVAIGRKDWYSACNTARPMLHTQRLHACRTGCSAPALCTFQQRISTLLQTLLETSGGAFAKGKMRTKSPSLSSHSLPVSLPNCTKTVILCVNKTYLFVYFWTVELQNSAKYIPDL